MDKERFSTLLQDPSLVTNADIKALNEYRKKYPYFQSLYVVVAKALKDREHPKTEAFIKKAAIYSANRSHLKEIIEGDFSFSKPKQETEQKPVLKVDQSIKAKDSLPQTKTEKIEGKDEVKEKLEENTDKEKPAEQSSKEKEGSPAMAEKPEDKQPAETPKTAADQEKIDNDLAEIEAAKRRIEALLSGQLDETQERKKEKPLSEKKKNQIQIIEKFIQNEPQLDRERMAQAEGNVDIEDLADKSILKEEAFETETLAELMAKQGKLKKAESIYKKLSLKFPEKSTYFATQIEKLKS